MTDDRVPQPGSHRQAIAAAFDGSTDPLADHAPVFERLDADPFTVFLAETLPGQAPAESTRRSYERLIDEWRTHMASEQRHPACPNEGHVRSFVTHCRTEGDNQSDTIRTKLRRLSTIYESWQTDPVFPHPDGYNPFDRLLLTMALGRSLGKTPPRISIAVLGEIIRDVTHLRDRLVIVMQLKLGLRASELANLCLQDLHIDAPVLQRAYRDLGSHPRLEGRPNAIYIASRYERAGNKSHRPRVLPIDDELQPLLRAYLLVRPDAATSALVLTKSTHNPVDPEYLNEIWTDVFHPTYAETDEHRGVTSHFGRHRFTTYWRVEADVNRALVKYMRGDAPAEDAVTSADAIDEYVHTYYEDIEQLYRERMFRLGLSHACGEARQSTEE